MHKVLLTFLIAMLISGTGERGAYGSSQWVVFAQHEEKALRDYAWRMTSSDVIENAYQLRSLARSPFGTLHASCGSAALILSHMITGHYFSARRLAVSADWHAMSVTYVAERSRCLAELEIDDGEFPLPSWFGR